jgi:hypothetical protein
MLKSDLLFKAKRKRDQGFTKAALAGLASTEDFTNIKLKTSDEATNVNEYPPYKDVMLVQVKGNLHDDT